MTEETITYMLRDKAGFIRGRGITSLEAARDRARHVAEIPGSVPITITKVTYTATRIEEDVEKFDE